MIVLSFGSFPLNLCLEYELFKISGPLRQVTRNNDLDSYDNHRFVPNFLTLARNYYYLYVITYTFNGYAEKCKRVESIIIVFEFELD